MTDSYFLPNNQVGHCKSTIMHQYNLSLFAEYGGLLIWHVLYMFFISEESSVFCMVYGINSHAGNFCASANLANSKRFGKRHQNYLSHRTTKSTIRLVRPAMTQLSLRIRAVWSEPLQIAHAFYRLQTIQRGINDSLALLGGCTGWSASLLVIQVSL